MTDFALQRRNMVESQVRPSDVTDRRIIAAMLDVPREEFAPEERRQLAYMDGDVTIAAAQPGRPPRSMMSPRVFAKLLDLAEFEPSDVVLDIGTGSGYSAAVIGKLVDKVVGLECDAGLAAKATKSLASLSIANVAVVQGELGKGWPAAAPFAAIVCEGSVSTIPYELLPQLKDGGRLVAVLNEGAGSRAVVWRRLGDSFDRREVFDAAAPPLPGFERVRVFSL